MHLEEPETTRPPRKKAMSTTLPSVVFAESQDVHGTEQTTTATTTANTEDSGTPTTSIIRKTDGDADIAVKLENLVSEERRRANRLSSPGSTHLAVLKLYCIQDPYCDLWRACVLDKISLYSVGIRVNFQWSVLIVNGLNANFMTRDRWFDPLVLAKHFNVLLPQVVEDLCISEKQQSREWNLTDEEEKILHAYYRPVYAAPPPPPTASSPQRATTLTVSPGYPIDTCAVLYNSSLTVCDRPAENFVSPDPTLAGGEQKRHQHQHHSMHEYDTRVTTLAQHMKLRTEMDSDFT